MVQSQASGTNSMSSEVSASAKSSEAVGAHVTY